jgi:hypothetical protein
MPIDMLKDLLPVASVASNQFFLSVNPNVPAKTVPELVEYARKQKPPLAYASGGNGSQHQLGIEMLKQRAGIDMLHVPYRGGAPAGRATVAGETQVAGWRLQCGPPQGGQRGLATTERSARRCSRHADDCGILSGLRPDDRLGSARAARPRLSRS